MRRKRRVPTVETGSSASSFRVLGLRVQEPLKLLEAVRDVPGVQAVDARCVAGRPHLEAAAERALTAEERGKRIADEPEVEVLLYAAATRQIDRAIERMGIDGETEAVGLVDLEGGFDPEELSVGIERDDSVLEFREEKLEGLKDLFDITEAELGVVGLEKVPLLVRERVVLSDLER